MLVFSAADFEDFRQPRPDMPPEMEGELEEVVRILAQNRWPWRLHAAAKIIGDHQPVAFPCCDVARNRFGNVGPGLPICGVSHRCPAFDAIGPASENPSPVAPRAMNWENPGGRAVQAARGIPGCPNHVTSV